MLERVLAANNALIAEGVLPQGIDLARIVVEPPRDASHGDMATNAAMVLAKDAGKKPRDLAEALAAKLRADPIITKVDIAGPGFINLTLKTEAWTESLRQAIRAGSRLWPQRDRAGREDQCGICLRQSDRPDACRPLPRRGVRRCARQSAGVHRLRRHARILHQRCRRAGRRARALGLSALPRSARRNDRRHSGRALSRRLSEAGRRSARQGIREIARRQTGIGMAGAGARQSHRHDDG